MLIALFAATILMADSTSALQTAGPAPQAAVTAPDTAKPKTPASNALVCKMEPVLGTSLSTKKCRTVEQMAQQRQEDQANLDKMQPPT